MTNQVEEPIYDNKVRQIIHELNMGKSREQIAEEMNYASYKSFDMYMSRRNLRWNAEIQNYEPKQATVKRPATPELSGTKLIRSIISSFKQGKNSREVAKLYKFKSNAELGKYMKEQGYEWDSEVNNYLEVSGKDVMPDKNLIMDTPGKQSKTDISSYHPANPNQGTQKPVSKQEPNSKDGAGDLKQSEPEQRIMHLLVNYEDKLEEVLNISQYSNQIPRYAIPGAVTSKSFQVNYSLTMMLKQYCDERNVTQREILEGALIEFMKKYGYESEVKQEFNC